MKKAGSTTFFVQNTFPNSDACYRPFVVINKVLATTALSRYNYCRRFWNSLPAKQKKTKALLGPFLGMPPNKLFRAFPQSLRSTYVFVCLLFNTVVTTR